MFYRPLIYVLRAQCDGPKRLHTLLAPFNPSRLTWGEGQIISAFKIFLTDNIKVVAGPQITA